MFKEIKYIIFVFIIGLFIFFTAKYYFSDVYKKKSYRSLNNVENKITPQGLYFFRNDFSFAESFVDLIPTIKDRRLFIIF